MNSSEIGVNKFIEGYNCAQSVLFSLSEYTDLSEDFSLKVATGFGGGMGRTQHVCGAVSGGILALNLLYGRGLSDGKDKQDDVYIKVRELIKKFETENDTIICKELLDGCSLLTDEGRERYRSKGMNKKCHSYIASVIEIVKEIIETN
ncbi:MAG: C-GCAxxG-C-C family protein [Spirochaetales bacterium]|nr:C-GCAxxG-C-C family protein [Spirochaetales bacterium]